MSAPADSTRDGGAPSTAYLPTGFNMIKSAEIKNFRCFDLVRLTDCRTINAIVGTNASGKTALLESLFLASGASPEIVLRMRNWRGYEGNIVGTSQEIDRLLWSDVFHNFDLHNSISIDLKGTDSHTRTVKARFNEHENFVNTPIGQKAPTFESQIEFSYKKPKTPERKVTVALADGIYQFRGIENVEMHSAFFASSYPFPNTENVSRFSRISKARKEHALIEAVSREFGFITGLEVLSHGGTPMLHVDTPWFPEKVPISSISSGVAKLVYLLIAIVAMPKSVLFIDEIENGLYYARFPSVWKTLHRLCKENDVQIFASTHSYECLEGLKEACKESAEDVSLIRATNSNGTAVLEQFHGSTIIPAIGNREVR